MKIGLVSDSHGNLRLLHRAADILLAQGVESFWHLGDDHPDAEELRPMGLPVAVVPGNYADEYRRGTLPYYLVQDVEGSRLVMLHDPADLHRIPRPALEAGNGSRKLRAVLHGHTHHYRAEPDSVGRDFVWINPGHLKRAEDRGRPASCGLLDAGSEGLSIRVLGLDGSVLLDAGFSIGNPP